MGWQKKTKEKCQNWLYERKKADRFMQKVSGYGFFDNDEKSIENHTQTR